jgi:hypothetical protein
LDFCRKKTHFNKGKTGWNSRLGLQNAHPNIHLSSQAAYKLILTSCRLGNGILGNLVRSCYSIRINLSSITTLSLCWLQHISFQIPTLEHSLRNVFLYSSQRFSPFSLLNNNFPKFKVKGIFQLLIFSLLRFFHHNLHFIFFLCRCLLHAIWRFTLYPLRRIKLLLTFLLLPFSFPKVLGSRSFSNLIVPSSSFVTLLSFFHEFYV